MDSSDYFFEDIGKEVVLKREAITAESKGKSLSELSAKSLGFFLTAHLGKCLWELTWSVYLSLSMKARSYGMKAGEIRQKSPLLFISDFGIQLVS